MSALKSSLLCVVVLLAGVLPLSASGATTIVVPNVDGDADNLRVESLGATTAYSVSYGNHVVGPSGTASRWERPIVQFPVSDFSAVSGLSLLSATLYYNIASDFFEAGESASSEVRLFTTDETALEAGNMDVYAGLSGDGGANTAIGSVNFTDGLSGSQTLAFSPAALTALYNAINGADATIGIAFREFNVRAGASSPDLLDEFVFGVPPSNMSIYISVPEPATLSLMAVSGLALLRRRRR